MCWKTTATRIAICVAALFGVASATAAGEPELDVQAELRALRAEVAQLRANQDQTWLNERRAEQVKALVREVLADADSRASFAEGGGLTAGHDGRFFIASEDGNHRLNIGGQIQFRYVANFRSNPDEGHETESGFQLRRTRLHFAGHVFDPRLTFHVQPEVRRDGGGLTLASLTLGYRLSDAWQLTVGRMKAPFLKEEMHSSTRQLAVDRSAVNNAFTGERTVGVQLAYSADRFRAYGQVNQGFDTTTRRFDDNDNTARLGLTGRVEARLAGDWRQFRDFVAWSDQPFGLFLGAAAHYEDNRTNRFGGPYGNTLDFATWTADVSAYYQRFSAFAAFVGRHDTKVVAGAEQFDDYGLVLQGAYNVNDRIVPFVRFNYMMPDDARDTHDVKLLNAGVNYYFHGHAAKLTTDVVWALNSLSGFYTGSEGLGLLPDRPNQRDQIALRAQFQLLF